jgi:hypothetical protein
LRRCDGAAALVLVVAALLASTWPASAHAAGYRSVSSGGDHACAIRVDDDAIVCWGHNDLGQSDAPAGRYAAAFAGSCATRLVDRTAVCWGWNHAYYEQFLPAGPVVSIARGSGFLCSVSADGQLRCGDKWPTCDICDDGVPLSQTPPGAFTAVTAGNDHACGIRAGDGTLACWGGNEFGEASPPSGAFASISAAYDATCGVRLDHALLCWGLPAQDYLRPPPGSFTTVAAGASHACALRTDGSIACWGRGTFGETNAPAGRFTEVSSSCAIRIDGSLACWGPDDYGQADPPAIDRTPPIARCSASPSVLWPRNHKLVPIAVEVSVDDATSGPAGFRLLSVSGDADDAQGWAIGTADTAGFLRAETRGHFVRRYALRYRGFDQAGNASDCTVIVTVPANRGRSA